MKFFLDLIVNVTGMMMAYGGCVFFVLLVRDMFCSIGNEFLFVSDTFMKEKKSLPWNRRK